MNNKWKKRIQDLGLDHRKELLSFIIAYAGTLGVGISITIFMSPTWGILVAGMAVLIVNFYYSYKYQLLEENRQQGRIHAFIDAFNVLKVFLSNGYNVYRSLEETIKYVKPQVREPLMLLVEDIDADKTLTPYIAFARLFKVNIIEQLMVALYQMDIEGGDIRQLEGFEYMFDQFRSEQKRDMTRRYEEQLDSMNTWPLLGAGIIAINLLIGVIGIIMEAIGEL